MSLLGILLVLSCGITGLIMLLSDDSKSACVLFIVALIGSFLWINDATSPIEVTESYYITNDYERYDIDIDSEELGRIKRTKTEATRFGAIWEDSVKYDFIEFIDSED